MNKGDKVVLTDAEKAKPFWKGEPMRDGTGTVLGPYLKCADQSVVRMERPGMPPRTYYLKNSALAPAPAVAP